MADRYASFAELSRHECEGADYAIELQSRDSRVAVIAPHGGFIEPNTTPVARAIAEHDLSFYSFSGLRPGRPHRDLHITSHRFDEPRCLTLAGTCKTIIAIHGKQDLDDPLLVYFGGLDAILRERMREALSGAGFEARFDAQRYPGADPSNICNRGRSRRGVQLELPRTLRDNLARHPKLLKQFAQAVRSAVRKER
jgi:phage replication-related protein YjqB (UPF0714/DUF867 family)